MYTRTTNGIKITVLPTYLEGQSAPSDDHFVWAYTIQMENQRNQNVQLINRHWQITDASGAVQEVRGPGVVGEQPVLKPGEAFQYTSGAALRTPSGIMQGKYEMTGEDGGSFLVDIPAFSLDSPQQTSRPN